MGRDTTYHPVLRLWSCCNCTREVNEDWDTDWCPDCGHKKCDECRPLVQCCRGCDGCRETCDISKRYDFRSTGIATSTSEPCSDLIIDHLRAKGRHLAIFLDSNLVPDACADSGSEVNCITSEFATKLGATISVNECVFDLPIKGRELLSIGTAMIKCKFPFEPFMA
jgi:hypothetical protein